MQALPAWLRAASVAASLEDARLAAATALKALLTGVHKYGARLEAGSAGGWHGWPGKWGCGRLGGMAGWVSGIVGGWVAWLAGASGCGALRHGLVWTGIAGRVSVGMGGCAGAVYDCNWLSRGWRGAEWTQRFFICACVGRSRLARV